MNQGDLPEYIVEVLEPLGTRDEPIFAKRMFGGHGIFRGDRMFALIGDGAFYLKTDAVNQPRFDAAGLEPFCFEKAGKVYAMSYSLAPPAALDDPAILREWAAESIRAALAAPASKKRKRRPTSPE